jgi:LemA protein
VSGALGRLIALRSLSGSGKASANFQQLAGGVVDLENKIAASRRFFNNAVHGEYNTASSRCRRIIASMFRLTAGFLRSRRHRTRVEAVPTVKFWERAVPPVIPGRCEASGSWDLVSASPRFGLASACPE